MVARLVTGNNYFLHAGMLFLSDTCNRDTTDSDSSGSSGSELDTAKASEPLSITKVIGLHTVSDVMVY